MQQRCHLLVDSKVGPWLPCGKYGETRPVPSTHWSRQQTPSAWSLVQSKSHGDPPRLGSKWNTFWGPQGLYAANGVDVPNGGTREPAPVDLKDVSMNGKARDVGQSRHVKV